MDIKYYSITALNKAIKNMFDSKPELNNVFIKGEITSDLGITWTYPILSNGKYSNITISFTISEIDPYDARTARKVGSYRNVSTNLDYSNVYDVKQ